jgi:hypothetical protein
VKHSSLKNLKQTLFHLLFRFRFTRNPHLSARDQILILDGFLLFNEPRLLALCTLKYDFSLPYEVAKRRRETRVYEPPDVPGYFDQVSWQHRILK